ncbi:malate dehydrogenase [Methanolinea mesophila]|uniref:malate dehydrogenase n=1 Tax=Methanolinea mesophila TaxID=547055 RepID=UPI001AE21B35|nr:lactate dehydrogenase [Methanolinea mesophila]MBP1929844.1 malate dehydrogenase [Methanolinea mesophila]
MVTLAVLGTGKIGGEVAYLAAMSGLIDRMVMYDAAKPFLRAQVLDIQHTGLDIEISTDWRAARDADVCVFSAGIPRTPEVKTRADLLSANIPVADECSLALNKFTGVLITVTNPMDANNLYLCRKNGFEPSRCIGFGGQLDSARFGIALKKKGISGDPWVLGDHGEYQVPLFSRLDAPVDIAVREEILAGLRGASMEVIQGKGGTVFGPAYHIAGLMRSIILDERRIIPCSCVLEGEYGVSGCSLGVPAEIGREGICSIKEWDLDTWEREHFDAAAGFVRDLAAHIGH